MPFEEDDFPGRRATISLTGLAVTVLLVVAALVVVRKLQVRLLMAECAQIDRPGCAATVDRLRVSRALSRFWGSDTGHEQ